MPQLKFTHASVILNSGADLIILYTELPVSEPLAVRFNAAYDKGADYVRKHFGIEPKIIPRIP